ncbi:hypothetical protein EXIGLDRAFT_775341 [Exidia glandulosa HHB12029]|uniref:Uncharacterized protein n=1 Tax=Exidia glandulosa HHB12029 TaxID=1314781 RepID=A0A165DYP2_EXIGL|nr:hypothetical protein EXIGLDRAFT_775341 [Exidia glandulosa HHB12029]
MEPLERPDITLTYGMIELGMALAMFLTGIATLQIWNYLSTYYQDSKLLISTVISVYVMDSVHTAFLLHASFHYLVQSFGDYEALNAVSWSIEACVIMNGFIAFAVQVCTPQFYTDVTRVPTAFDHRPFTASEFTVY